MPLSQLELDQNIDKIFNLYTKFGNEEYGENITQLMHMMQSANCAIREGANTEMVVAAFLHDIGHFLEGEHDMDGYGRHDHDRLGAEFLLSMGFPERLAKLVYSHVATKRYLTFKDPEYLKGLSEASKITLKFQGGPMDATEAAVYGADPLINEYIKIRLWDDLGKETDIPVAQEEVEQMKKRIKDYLMLVQGISVS